MDVVRRHGVDQHWRDMYAVRMVGRARHDVHGLEERRGTHERMGDGGAPCQLLLSRFRTQVAPVQGRPPRRRAPRSDFSAWERRIGEVDDHLGAAVIRARRPPRGPGGGQQFWNRPGRWPRQQLSAQGARWKENGWPLMSQIHGLPGHHLHSVHEPGNAPSATPARRRVDVGAIRSVGTITRTPRLQSPSLAHAGS
jgi:hypothetical protein